MKVVQSWDDGVVDDIRLADLLRRHQASATFNLNPGLHQAGRSFSWRYGDKEVWRLGRDELVEVYAGFEIANHSLSHPNLPDLSLADLEREVRDSRRILQEWFQQPVRGFCYPFGGFDPAVKEAVRAAGHVYARTVTECEPVFPPADPFEFGVGCRFADPWFWARYERARASSNSVFFFWGHSYELVDESMWADLENKIARIGADPAAEWASIERLF
ncbi:MAG: polysaccharide deacetylase family protein [Candidatus Competibacter sp.]|nr:polysaccharide deacetylase family protein [Candidatus Competibacter sp.]MDG4585175.1 polysaccharide deacetylase family protein [Candidatus Competibacter sp.]